MTTITGALKGSPLLDLNSPCVAESGGPERGEETCCNHGVCKDQLRVDLTCLCVAESSRPQCEEETCYTQGSGLD
jgi:hypothetical protein